MSVQALRSVDVASLEDYPEALSDPSLSSDYFTKFWHDRWLSSRLHLKGSLAVQGAALNLFFLARKQTPVGSLPIEQDLLASLLRVSDVQWGELMRESITPLHGWTPYAYEGEVVLGHRVVIEVAVDAMERREARKLSSEEKAVTQRRMRLVGTMRAVGLGPAACADKALVAWLDEWLLTHHHGQRRSPQIETSVTRGISAAAAAGKFNAGR